MESQNIEENLPPYDPKASSPSGVYRLANSLLSLVHPLYLFSILISFLYCFRLFVVLDQAIVPDLLIQAKSLLTASKKSFDLEKLRDPQSVSSRSHL